MLNTYIVRIKNVEVDGYKKYLSYLNNSNHKNHTKHNTKILNFKNSNREDFETNMNYKILKNKRNYKLNKKGGKKLNVCAKSLTFNIPTSYNPNKEDIVKIYNEILQKMKGIYKRNLIHLESNDIYSNVHYQENTHINMIIPTLDFDGNVIRFVKSKNFINEMRIEFNKIVDKQMNTNIEEYKSQSKEEIKQNKVRSFMNELIMSYQNELQNGLLDENSTKYLTNQIKVLKRVLNEFKEVEKEFKEENITYEKKVSLINKIIEKKFDRIELNSRKYTTKEEQRVLDNEREKKPNVPKYK